LTVESRTQFSHDPADGQIARRGDGFGVGQPYRRRNYQCVKNETISKEHAMAEALRNSIASGGIDIGKNSFHVVGQDERGAIVLRQKWSRGQVEARFANLQRGGFQVTPFL
jgi:hypothetical protein